MARSYRPTRNRRVPDTMNNVLPGRAAVYRAECDLTGDPNLVRAHLTAPLAMTPSVNWFSLRTVGDPPASITKIDDLKYDLHFAAPTPIDDSLFSDFLQLQAFGPNVIALTSNVFIDGTLS